MGRPRKPISDAESRQLAKIAHDMANLDRRRAKLALRRDELIQRAARRNAGQDAIARAAGVTKARVAQIARESADRRRA